MRMHFARFVSRPKTKRIAVASLALVTFVLIAYNYANLLPARLGGMETKYSDYQSPLPADSSSTKLYADESKGNDVLLTLIRNSELDQMVKTIEMFERRFNSRYHYDWWFMNDEEFTEDFKAIVTNLVSGRSRFIKIPKELWSYPEHIDQERAASSRQTYREQKIMYGGSESYRFMCRFNSGLFYKLPELKDIEYYWRVEPGTRFTCDISYDVFQYMRENDKIYAFNMALQENQKTIPSLWNATKEFMNANPMAVNPDNLMGFVTDDEGETYNLCHFWSNFEIANLKFFRSPAYESYFEFLDKKGGFFYERWGDAPVHTLAVAIMAPAESIHFVANTGYYHQPNQDCPPDGAIRDALNCQCNPQKDFTWHKWSCVRKFFDIQGLVRPNSMENISSAYPSIYDSIVALS
ncbi:(ZYRO0B01672g) [Zygosaccharomyces parabailii]|nr:(ZYRO0B01672g) [Zygosaccharomyces parabailii]CDH12056.1 related to alpha-1,2-mannosyltransferase (Kre2) [Zygosaccharomyces bailii ISA1307]